MKDHVTALWGGRNRKWANYGRLITQVQHVTYEDAIRFVDRRVGGFIPSPADIIAIKATTPALPRLEYVPVYCGDHRLELVDGPYSPPFEVCRNTGCDYRTDKIGDQDG